jgi:hypothetical protein
MLTYLEDMGMTGEISVPSVEKLRYPATPHRG